MYRHRTRDLLMDTQNQKDASKSKGFPLLLSLLMSEGKERAGSPVKGKWTGILALSSTWLWEARVSYSASLNFTGLLGMLLISELLYVNYSAHTWSVISIKNDSD